MKAAAGLPTGAAPQLDCNRIHYNEIAVYGAFSSTRHQAGMALALISTKTLDAAPFITHRLPLDEVVRGIAMKRTGESIKAVVQPWADHGRQV